MAALFIFEVEMYNVMRRHVRDCRTLMNRHPKFAASKSN